MAAPNLDFRAGSLHQRLGDGILFGRHKSRRKLRLDRLRADYNASVASLREVMSRSQAEGFLTFELQKGYEDSARDLKEISDIQILRVCHAITLSSQQGDLE